MERTENLTTEEKLRLLTAKSGFTTEDLDGKMPVLTVADGPAGLRIETESFPKGKPSLCYPAPHVIANSWNRKLAERVGEAIASDCIDEGVDILLAPGVNIKRIPLCGRNFEYFSEDPYLAGALASEYICGVQSLGIGASLKHFCANNREWDRGFQSSEIDERTLMEIYVKPFEIAIRDAKPWTVMCAYNPVNGVYASENGYLLKKLLRERLGFKGVVISDWGAVHDRCRALAASLDLEFPYNPSAFGCLSKGLDEGKIHLREVDESAERLVALLEKKEREKPKRKALSQTLRRETALKGAREGIVLLKNENLLPLKSVKRLAVLGSLAETPSVSGGGSARVVPSERPETLAKELSGLLQDCKIDYYGGYVYSSSILPVALPQISGQNEAAKLAYHSDAVIIVVGTNQLLETECYDRNSLRLPPELEKFILDISKENENIAVVVESGGAVDMTAWIDKVKAVVYTGFAGQYMNRALAEILTGKICPSGKLSESFPLSLDDTPTGTRRGDGFAERYSEGIFVGYRWYDKEQKEVLFPFGFGLSYTSFEYSDLRLGRLKDGKVKVSFRLKNTGDRTGKEIVQIYVCQRHAPVTRPEKELKAFDKVELKAGEEKLITAELCREDFAVWSVVHERWHVFGGDFEVLAGASSRDVRLSARLTIEGD